eukprot:387772-Pelagomonas_calceolata.AAC.4
MDNRKGSGTRRLFAWTIERVLAQEGCLHGQIIRVWHKRAVCMDKGKGAGTRRLLSWTKKALCPEAFQQCALTEGTSCKKALRIDGKG